MSKINLTINADSADDLRTILLGLVANVNLTKIDVRSDDPDKVAEKIADAAKDQPAKTSTKKAADKPKETKQEAKEPEPSAPDESVEKAKKEASANAKKPSKAEEGDTKGPELPDNIKNTNSMRDLLTYLSEHGVDSADAMVATCQVLKKDVPILSKVPNVDERVRRALEVLALYPEGEAAQA